MNRLLTNVNKLPIVLKHLSAKFNLNDHADLHSRHTPTCDATICSVHKFVQEAADSVLDTGARCATFEVDTSFTNRIAWKKAQENSDSVKSAVAHMVSGKVPHSRPGDLYNEMRHYVRHGTLAPDGLLITTGDSQTYLPGENKNKIVVPRNVAPGLLYHLHNRNIAQHPSMSQLKATYNRHFYTWNLQPLLDKLYENCNTSSII